MSSWGLLCVLIPSLACVPHCIMYEGICILYLAGLAVVGRNSSYLLFIARAMWPHGLSIELALTTQYSPPDTAQLSSDLPCCCCWNQFFVFNWKQRENNGVVTMDPKGVELHTAPASDKENKTKSFQSAGSAGGIWGRTWLRSGKMLSWHCRTELKWWYVRLYWYSYYGHFLLSSSISIYIHYSL